MHVLVVAAQKGGSGKTTLSGHLAVEAEHAGAGPVAILDADPQRSLQHWRNSRSGATPVLAHATLPDLSRALHDLREAGIDLVVVDTPPAITVSISNVIAHADLVLIPTRPSPHDLRAVGATVEIAERHGKPVVFVMNGATARARITAEAAVALSQHGTVAPVTVHQRVDFAASMVDGRTVGEVVPESASAKEIRDLWTYLQDRLSRLQPDSLRRTMPRAPELSVNLLPLLAMPDDAAMTFDAPPAEASPGAVDPASDTRSSENPRFDLPLAETGEDRRSGVERRKSGPLFKPFGSGERRVNPFGRRASDRSSHFAGAGK